ncbi:MAG: hypothetical protein AAFQ94_25395 [Bacteroidota bacterium]
MKFKTFLITVFTYLLVTSIAKSQTLDLIQKSIAEAEEGKYTSIDFRLFATSNDISKSIELLSSFGNDSIESVRNRVLMIAGRLQPHLQLKADREGIVLLLCQRIVDQSTGIAGNALEYLKDYNSDDFNVVAKQEITEALQNGSAHYSELIKIAGYVDIANLTNQLTALSTVDSLSAEVKWSIKLAQARNGDENAISFIMNRINRYPVNDRFMYQILPSALYLKNQQIAELLSEIILSDEKSCKSADMEQDQSIICGYQAMQYLGKMVVEFPIAVDSNGYPETDNYELALQTIRDWLKTDPDFKFDKSTY